MAAETSAYILKKNLICIHSNSVILTLASATPHLSNKYSVVPVNYPHHLLVEEVQLSKNK
jgi:hypothetical protein